MRESTVPKKKEFLVATCICDGTGFRVGIVTATTEREAMSLLGTEVIGHEEASFWEEYVDRHDPPLDEDFFDFIKNREGERITAAAYKREDLTVPSEVDLGHLPIKRAVPFLDREEPSYNRWILVAEIERKPLGDYLICYHDEEGEPRMTFVEEVNRGWIEAHPEFWIEIFQWKGGQEHPVFEDVTERFFPNLKRMREEE